MNTVEGSAPSCPQGDDKAAFLLGLTIEKDTAPKKCMVEF